MSKMNFLDRELERIVAEMAMMDPTTQEYTNAAANLERMTKAKNTFDGSKKHLSPDAILAAGVGLLQVGMILGHERLHVISSKAMSFIVKGRI